jgi:7,8-dihydropterin-6-yl-methyl-4-(beta-D-ribofuranosyl)aminobenzene 5'-phosphate synthase
LKITALIENKNTDNENLVAEHGLSLHIQTKDKNILFDTGASGVFTENALELGINISDVNLAVISHGHYDHGGGLESFISENKKAPIYLRNSTDEEYFFKAFIFMKRPVGLDKELLNNKSSRFNFISQNTEIEKDIFLITGIKQDNPIPPGSKYLYKKVDGELQKDDFHHELMMVIKDNEDIVLFTGCSHHGILNMVETALELFPGSSIKAVFGGFHLIGLPMFNNMAASKPQVEEIGSKLMEYPIEKVYTGHCTGEKAYNVLKDIMGDKLEYFSTGTSIKL